MRIDIPNQALMNKMIDVHPFSNENFTNCLFFQEFYMTYTLNHLDQWIFYMWRIYEKSFFLHSLASPFSWTLIQMKQDPVLDAFSIGNIEHSRDEWLSIINENLP